MCTEIASSQWGVIFAVVKNLFKFQFCSVENENERENESWRRLNPVTTTKKPWKLKTQHLTMKEFWKYYFFYFSLSYIVVVWKKGMSSMEKNKVQFELKSDDIAGWHRHIEIKISTLTAFERSPFMLVNRLCSVEKEEKIRENCDMWFSFCDRKKCPVCEWVWKIGRTRSHSTVHRRQIIPHSGRKKDASARNRD